MPQPSPALPSPVSFHRSPLHPAALRSCISSPFQSWTGSASCSTQNTNVSFRSGGKRAEVKVLICPSQKPEVIYQPKRLLWDVCDCDREQTWEGARSAEGQGSPPFLRGGTTTLDHGFFTRITSFSPLSTCTQRPALVTLPVCAGVDGNGEEGAGFAPATDAPAQGDTETGKCWAHGTPRVQHCIQLTPSHRRNLPSGWAEGLTETSGLWLPQVCVINCTIPA